MKKKSSGLLFFVALGALVLSGCSLPGLDFSIPDLSELTQKASEKSSSEKEERSSKESSIASSSKASSSRSSNSSSSSSRASSIASSSKAVSSIAIEESSSDSITSTAPESSSSSIQEPTRAEIVSSLFERMANDESSEFNSPHLNCKYYGDGKAISYKSNVDDDSDGENLRSGFLRIPNYGLFSYAHDEDSDTICECNIFSANPNIDVGAVCVTTKDLGEAALNLTFQETFRTHTLWTTDTTFCNIIAGLLELDVDCFTGNKVTFQLSNSNDSLINMTLLYSDESGNSFSEGNISITNIGGTVSNAVENCIANDSWLSAKTDWSQTNKFSFTYMHEDFSLPYPEGSTWATTEEIVHNDPDTLVFRDYASGNLVESYKEQLVEYLFYENDDETNESDNHYVYERFLQFSEAKEEFAYYQKLIISFYDGEYEVIYPNGIFEIRSYVYQEEVIIAEDDLNSILTSHMMGDSETEPILPIIDFCEPGMIRWIDDTSTMRKFYSLYFDSLNFIFDCYAYCYYQTLESAEAFVSSVTLQMTEYGYVIRSQQLDHNDDCVIFDMTCKSDDETKDYSVAVIVTIEKDDDGNYLGYVSFSVGYYENDSVE